MHSNTLKTVFGFVRSVIARRGILKRDSTSIRDIYNYLSIDNLYSTSGQPDESQFGLIRAEGFATVINLAPTSILENSVVAESAILADLGMKYVHIPVDFGNPTDEDFGAFSAALSDEDPGKVWVHCAANMRVSAFTYRYRRDTLGENESAARADLHKIWEPFGVWKRFIEKR